MEKETQVLISIFVLFILLMVIGFSVKSKTKQITNFDECVAAGNPVMESYPRQCSVNGKTFVEEIVTFFMKDYGSKIVYTTDPSLNTSLFEKDCKKRQGVFNPCGDICKPDSDICSGLCAYTCEQIMNATSLDAEAREFCGKQNVASVFVCEDFIGVASSLLGGGTTYHFANNTEISCPIVSSENTSEECQGFMNITESNETSCRNIC